WEISVPSRPELSQGFASREEAIDQGRAVADRLGVAHVVHDAETTGDITDEAPQAGDSGSSPSP
ncbi:MAG TPA: DUF2188 domain-containing protein, partial [Agromyces sp.]